MKKNISKNDEKNKKLNNKQLAQVTGGVLPSNPLGDLTQETISIVPDHPADGNEPYL